MPTPTATPAAVPGRGVGRPRRLLLLTLLAAGFGVGAASGQPYLSGDIGFHRGLPLDVAGRSNDGPSYCDEYLNPHFSLIPACLEPGGGMWLLAFDSAVGANGAAALGYRISDRFRVEVEYFFRSSGYDQFAPAHGANQTAIGKLDGELVRAEEYIGNLNAHAVFFNFLVDFPTLGRFTPYIGAGAGFGLNHLDYGAVWARNWNPDQILSGADLGIPDYGKFQRALTGTTTTYHGQFSKTLAGFQVLAGADLHLSEQVAIGIKARTSGFARMEVEEPNGWDQLRSHPSGNRLDGSQPAMFWLEIEDIGHYALSVSLKYFF